MAIWYNLDLDGDGLSIHRSRKWGTGDHHLGWIPTTTTTGSSIYNKGSITEYMADDGDEFEMNTKINGCIPATNKYTES
ncbi:hypothetical protein D5086_003068 [Populus alba]|uniref:Uncharacterized protein n=1 Tax=Populus alba TaxID=43335 RepID=A0ACC4D4I0_POPAL